MAVAIQNELGDEVTAAKRPYDGVELAGAIDWHGDAELPEANRQNREAIALAAARALASVDPRWPIQH